MTDLALRRALCSPRHTPVPTPWQSIVIHGAVLVLWLLLLAGALSLHGFATWAAGVVYVLYDTALLIFTFFATLDLVRRGKPVPQAPQATPASLAVIVAAYNEVETLPATIAALRAQSAPPDIIMIADDGSTDGTARLLNDRYGLDPTGAPGTGSSDLRWLHVPHGGKARALNAALVTLETEIVVTVDADTLLAPNALAAMRAGFAEPGLVAATGVLAPVTGGSTAARVLQWFQTYEYIRNFLSRRAWMQQDGLLLISGAFAGFRRAAVVEVGGFEIDCLVEDYELIHRLRRYGALQQRGWTTRVLGDATARTSAPDNFGAFLRQRRRWFGGFLQTQFWYRDMVGNARYGRLGLAMLPVKAADTLQPVYGLTALAVLLVALIGGHLDVLFPVIGIIAAKIVLDLAFHLWSVHVYRRWVGGVTQAHLLPAFIAAVLEPFSFQILRHLGATMGWGVFLSGRHSWGKSSRTGLDQATESDDPRADGRTT